MKPRIIFLLLCWLPFAAVAADEVRPPRIMLATVYEAGPDVSEYWISEKLDGVRGYWDGEVLRTRNGNPVNPPAWFTAGWPDTPMDGELWIGRGRFDEVSGIVRAVEPDDDTWREVLFMVFDLPAYGGAFSERVAAMRSLLGDAGIAWLRPVVQFRVAGSAELDVRLEEIAAAGGEGLMLHHEDALYRAGRSQDLLKYKPYEDAEAVVVGYTRGQGKYEGMLGALVVERADGVRFRIGTGFTDAERADPPPLGSWVTYRYNGLTPQGFPRFARFLRIREDMPVHDNPESSSP